MNRLIFTLLLLSAGMLGNFQSAQAEDVALHQYETCFDGEESAQDISFSDYLEPDRIPTLAVSPAGITLTENTWNLSTPALELYPIRAPPRTS